MINGLNYYQILGVPEDALLKEIQSAWRIFVKENHEDVVPTWERQAAKERMFEINEAYEVLSNEEKRAHYDNSNMLNGGSTIELVRNRVRKAKEIIRKDLALMTGEDIKMIETIIDYLDRKTQKACFGRMIDMVNKRSEMAKYTVNLAFEEQLLNVNTTIVEHAARKSAVRDYLRKGVSLWRGHHWSWRKRKQGKKLQPTGPCAVPPTGFSQTLCVSGVSRTSLRV